MTENINERVQLDRLTLPNIDLWSVITALSMIVLEVSWLAPWCHLVTGLEPAGTLLRSYLTLGLTLALAYAVSKGLAILQLKQRVRMLCLLGFLALNVAGAALLLAPHVDPHAVLSLFPSGSNELIQPFASPLLVTTFAVLVGWWRGLGIAQGSLSSGQVMRGFRFGLIMILLYGVIQSNLGAELRYTHFYLFLCAGLTAMISARLFSLNRPGGRLGPTDRTWVAVAAVLVIGLVGLAALVAAIARGPFATMAASAASFVLDWTARILGIVLSPILYIAVRAMRYFVHLLNQATLPQSAQEPQVTPSAYDEWLHELRAAEPPPWADELFAWIRAILLAAALLAILWVFLSRLRRIRALKPTGSFDDQEGTVDRKQIRPALEAALRRGFYAVWDRLQALSERDRWEASEKVRRIYAQLMDLCAHLEMARPASTTPLEFLPVLKERFPEFQSELTTITHAYVRVRYGELPETRQEVDAVERAWTRVQARGRELYYEGMAFLRA